MQKIILITGASSGIGQASAAKLVADGHIVYGTARRESGAEAVRAIGAKPLIVEMTEYDSLTTAVETIVAAEGRIDVLINNAGYGCYGAVEDVPIDDAREQFEVNLFGLARLTQLVLPHLRAQRCGTIINISSMGGQVYSPLGAWYHASKHALEGWSDCLRLELAPFGINVVLIEPGLIATNFYESLIRPLAIRGEGGVYEKRTRGFIATIEGRYSQPGQSSEPAVVASTIARAVAAARPRTRYATGRYARLLMFLRRYGGDRLFDRLVTKMAG